MSRDPRIYLGDILACCQKISTYTEGHSFESFVSDEMVYDAVVRNLEIIGQATRLLCEDVRLQIPGVDWRGIVDFRNVLAHDYNGLDNVILWQVVTSHVPALRARVDAFLNR